MIKKIENLRYEILTPSGWKDFHGVAYMGKKNCITLNFSDGSSISCTKDHELFLEDGSKKSADKISVTDIVVTVNGKTSLVSKDEIDHEENVYDIVEVDGGNKFFADSILVSNCSFVSHGETLIDQIKVSSMQGIEPIRTQGQVRWYKEITPNKTYIASLDPSMGTGSDPAAIQVYSLPNLEQVAEWRSNQHPIKMQVQTLLTILNTINSSLKASSEQSGAPEIYWSVENNAVGEAALTVIEDTGEEKFPGIWIHEPKMRGNVRRFRKGLCTTHKNKMTACAKLKSLIEHDKMKVYSKSLVRELKHFESSGTSYKAKPGETDDLVMATILCLRIIDIISNWDTSITTDLSEAVDLDEGSDEPMPFTILANF
jgi:hypothetical protein